MNFFGVYHSNTYAAISEKCDAPCITKGRMRLCAAETASSGDLIAFCIGRLRNRYALLQLLGLLGGRQRLHHALFFAGDENRLRRAAARQDVVGKLTESLCEAVDHVAHFLFAPLAENKAHDDGENHHRITDTNNPLHEKILLKTGGPAGGRRRKLFADDEAKCPADKSRIREKTCQPGKHMLHFC